ncbi:MAG: hypothetical protein CL678_08740 [Bdellovibrionaceae bacterium]|nr:hypothetical protein [Pseudobdellovibrionaceae bacterium]|tara:strand:- start:5015 stop:5242 length:228 start_codon:yes stop_codon:yes gene_type:complete
MSRGFPKQLKNEGQAILEYIILMAVAFSIVASIGLAFRGLIFNIWQQITCEVSAPCPSCPPSEEIKNRLSPGACQ